MRIHKLTYAATQRFSPLVLDYLAAAPALRDQYARLPTLKGAIEAADARVYSESSRSSLSNALLQQYKDIPIHPKTQVNLELLAKNDCLTVTTGHQLCLFSGPLYVPFKILNIIRLAEELTKERGKPVVPVFWMATEDHDRPEIDHAWINGQKVHWPGEAGGAVGRSTLSGINEVVEQVINLLGPGEHAASMADLIRRSYRSENTLAQATRLFLNGLFGRFGVICIDGDDPELKRLFIPVLQEELINQVGERTVRYASEKLDQRYKVQAHAREINVFYLSEGGRSRIVLDGDRYKVLDGGPSFTLEGILEELNTNPERFSPNVILRPVYQEVVLPNIAYVGGGGELAYWLQLRWLFQGLQVPMPAVFLRTSAAFISEKHMRQWNELGFAIEDIFAPMDDLAASLVKRTGSIDISVEKEEGHLLAFYDGLRERVEAIEPSLRGSVEARKASAMRGLERIGKSLLRAAKHEQATELARMDRIHSAVFPGGGLQERRDNILPGLVAQGPEYLDELMKVLDPLDNEFTVITD